MWSSLNLALTAFLIVKAFLMNNSPIYFSVFICVYNFILDFWSTVDSLGTNFMDYGKLYSHIQDFMVLLGPIQAFQKLMVKMSIKTGIPHNESIV